MQIAVSHRATETQRRRVEDIAEKASFLFLLRGSVALWLCGSVALWLSIAIRTHQSPIGISHNPLLVIM